MISSVIAHRVLASIVLITAATGCGDDSSAGSGGGGGDGGPSTTSSTAATVSAASTGSPASSGGGPGSGGAGGGPGTGGGAVGGGDAGGGDTGGGEPASGCLTAEALAVLQDHLDAMSLSAQYLAGHPGAGEATGFLSAPALPSPPAVVGFFATLIAPCDGEAFDYDPYCDGGTCSQIGCTGEGAGWSMTTWAEEAHEGEGFSIATAEVVNTWTEGETGTDVAIAVSATGPDERDWSFVGTGVFAEDGVALEYAFDAWVAGMPASMVWSVDADGTLGEITAGDVVVATIGGPDEHFELTGECPR